MYLYIYIYTYVYVYACVFQNIFLRDCTRCNDWTPIIQVWGGYDY